MRSSRAACARVAARRQHGGGLGAGLAQPRRGVSAAAVADREALRRRARRRRRRRRPDRRSRSRRRWSSRSAAPSLALARCRRGARRGRRSRRRRRSRARGWSPSAWPAASPPRLAGISEAGRTDGEPARPCLRDRFDRGGRHQPCIGIQPPLHEVGRALDRQPEPTLACAGRTSRPRRPDRAAPAPAPGPGRHRGSLPGRGSARGRAAR